MSVGDEGQQGNDIAIPPSISEDGRFSPSPASNSSRAEHQEQLAAPVSAT